jgi:hypothetical protein
MPLQQSDQKLLASKELTDSVGLIAALPMYDWPEVRAETDAQWGFGTSCGSAASTPRNDWSARAKTFLPSPELTGMLAERS